MCKTAEASFLVNLSLWQGDLYMFGLFLLRRCGDSYDFVGETLNYDFLFVLIFFFFFWFRFFYDAVFPFILVVGDDSILTN